MSKLVHYTALHWSVLNFRVLTGICDLRHSFCRQKQILYVFYDQKSLDSILLKCEQGRSGEHERWTEAFQTSLGGVSVLVRELSEGQGGEREE